MRIVEVTPTQERQWNDTVALIGFQALSFRQLLYRLLNAQINTKSPYIPIYTDEIPVAATDAINILINPNAYFKYNLLNRVFILGHEIGHNVLGDVFTLHKFSVLGKIPMIDGSYLPFDNLTAQRAMDARLNAWLVESKIGKMPDDAVFDHMVKGTDSFPDIYKRYFKPSKCPPPPVGPGKDPPKKGPSGGVPGEGFDQMLPPGKGTGKNPHTTAAKHNPQKWASEIAIARELEKIKNQGTVPAALDRVFQEILKPKIPWTEHIRMFINRFCSGDDWDWTRHHQWYGLSERPDGTLDEYFYPSDTGKGAGWIVIWNDLSGSRNKKELEDSRSEVAGMLEQVCPRRLTVIDCDAEISQVAELSDPSELRTLKHKGGGGTSYKPVLDWIDKQPESPDLFIGFTDGEVDHPKVPPRYPVIWASSTDNKYPFGNVVKVK